MGKLLTSLAMQRTAEVSLVERGANKKKRFPIFKSEDQMEDHLKLLEAILENSAGEQEVALEAVIEKAELSDKGKSAVKGALRLLLAYKDEIPGAIVDKLSELAGGTSKAEEDEEYSEPKQKEKAVAKSDGLPEEVRKALDEEREAHKIELESIKKSAAETQEQLKKERDLRELGEWTQKAETELSHFPGKSSEELGKELKELNDLDPKIAEKQFESMKAASAAIQKSALLISAGSNFGFSQPDSAWGKIQKRASELVQKSSDLSEAQAIALVCQQNPDLYAAYENEKANLQGGV